ncbi:MAG TPA: radical SAM family heme chaperone HemW [Bryobacteraceae bacterium]|nr:radical SAM family heme chaperone HemW [Bryobacteraceae bacterium]
MPGVYISYPFCAQKCTYCNFASGVLPRELESRYVGALRADLRETAWPWTPETVYLGGGTPSQMDVDTLATLLAEIPGREWTEATIETAPGSFSREKAEAWRRAGINRVSLGVQSFIAKELSRTGRKHTAETVARDVETLRAAGIGNLNIDLIAGLPFQTRPSWNESLDWVERLGAPHVSVYMLEVDEDSNLGRELLVLGSRYGAGNVPSEDEIAEFYEIAVERLHGMGIDRYEISNFARSGFESRHNLKYWRREPYLGFGADAHSFDGEWRWQNPESAEDYVGPGPSVREKTAADPVAERFFLGLRLSEGIEGSWEPFADAIRGFIDEGLLEASHGRVRLTPRGVLLSNEVFQEFVGVTA